MKPETERIVRKLAHANKDEKDALICLRADGTEGICLNREIYLRSLDGEFLQAFGHRLAPLHSPAREWGHRVWVVVFYNGDLEVHAWPERDSFN